MRLSTPSFILHLVGIIWAGKILLHECNKIKCSSNLIVCLLVCLERPNYITDEEFAAVQGKSIIISNSSTLQLPPPGQERPVHARPGFGKNLWTNAQVPYTLDSSFDSNQREQVALAFKTYHEATCIRFIPKQDSHASWVHIELDPNACGLANLCMNTGEQKAAFGGTCVTAGVMVHELGHTLCMSHEQSRYDRDDWVTFNTSICDPYPKDGADWTLGLNKFYDYVSVEHYEDQCYNGCIVPTQPGVTKCGSGGALSVLDIEILNEVYGCTSGCQGYRYVNLGFNNDPDYLVPFGEEPYGDQLYSCRAYHHGDIIPGKYHAGRKECYVAWNGQEHSKTDSRIEVLTNPYNISLTWVTPQTNATIPVNAIRGGRSNERVPLYAISCQVVLDGKTVWHPGKYHPSVGAYTSFGGSEIKCDTYEFILCG